MTATPVPADLTGRLRDDPDFRRYWLARVLSVIGSMVTVVALPVLVYRLSGSPFLTALVSALEAAPYLLFGLFAGALSDRWNRRTVMISSDLVNALVIGSIPVAHWLGVLTVAHVLVAGFVVQAVYTFFDGANFGALPVLVGRTRVAEANASVWAASSLVELLVPASAGLLLAVLNPATLVAIDALSFAASAVAVRGIVRAMSERREGQLPLRPRVLFADIGEGMRFLVRHAGVRTMTVVGTLQSLAGGGFVALMVVWCDRVLDIGTEGLRFGIVFGAWGIGGLIAAVALPKLLTRLPPAAITLYALPMSAVLSIVSALAPTWPLAAASLLVWGIAYMLVIVNSISYRQQVTPEQLLGRVNTAGRMLSWGVGWTLGATVGGVVGAQLGIRPAMVVMGCPLFVGVVVAWLSPLRRIAAAHGTPAAEAEAEAEPRAGTGTGAEAGTGAGFEAAAGIGAGAGSAAGAGAGAGSAAETAAGARSAAGGGAGAGSVDGPGAGAGSVDGPGAGAGSVNGPGAGAGSAAGSGTAADDR